MVFIHRSIKTRIETSANQSTDDESGYVFIHRSIKTRIETTNGNDSHCQAVHVFIHRSIKTRIETLIKFLVSGTVNCFYT